MSGGAYTPLPGDRWEIADAPAYGGAVLWVSRDGETAASVELHHCPAPVARLLGAAADLLAAAESAVAWHSLPPSHPNHPEYADMRRALDRAIARAKGVTP